MLLTAALLIAAAPAPLPARSAMRQCYLRVDGKVHVNARCRVFPLGGKSYTLNTWDGGKPRRSHFAQVSEGKPGRGEASWNADPNDNRAGDPLGSVRWSKGCWINTRVKICAR
ncbi:hypothetical protein [Sphingomonas sp. S2-65]|uniref:hypothetical protein n=1 Tax=Sphingomonas sp. S2-65 TaxID=2903960 RepID=UPI001F42BF56|nr:hypothetical protein [Sphingomonas sp. S2-65]UYY59781.1 hypothetical protein LZ586_06765 [Sphingomonas sp. S2-65]